MSVLHRVDPELTAILKQLPVIDLASIPAARAALEAVFAAVGTAPPDPAVDRADRIVPGVDGRADARVRLYRPKAEQGELPCLVWIHGGGYVLTTADADDQWCEEIAKKQRCLVISVDWRRAPEHQYPAAHDDCYGTFLWASKNAKSLGIDATRIVVGGASSGGGAAAGVALRARDRGEAELAHQLLIYPMIDDRSITSSSRAVTDPELWNRQNNVIAWQAYLGELYGSDRVPAYAAPTRATELAGLAPATILTAELDLFVDENIEYAQRLMHSGVPTELHSYPAANHGFDRLNPTARVSRRMLADRDDALSRAFARA